MSVLQIHGDADPVVLYDGGANILNKGGGAYAGAVETTARWAKDDGCRATRSDGGTLDLDQGLPGAETVVTSADGCPAGVDVALWTIRGGSHTPQFSGRFAAPVWKWLEAHPRR